MEAGDEGIERVEDSKNKALDKLTDPVEDRQLDSTRLQESKQSDQKRIVAGEEGIEDSKDLKGKALDKLDSTRVQEARASAASEDADCNVMRLRSIRERENIKDILKNAGVEETEFVDSLSQFDHGDEGFIMPLLKAMDDVMKKRIEEKNSEVQKLKLELANKAKYVDEEENAGENIKSSQLMLAEKEKRKKWRPPVAMLVAAAAAAALWCLKRR